MFVDGTLQDIQARNTLNLFLNICKKKSISLDHPKTGINKRLKREMKWKWNNEICIGRGKDSCIKRQCRPILMIIYPFPLTEKK